MSDPGIKLVNAMLEGFAQGAVLVGGIAFAFVLAPRYEGWREPAILFSGIAISVLAVVIMLLKAFEYRKLSEAQMKKEEESPQGSE